MFGILGFGQSYPSDLGFYFLSALKFRSIKCNPTFCWNLMLARARVCLWPEEYVCVSKITEHSCTLHMIVFFKPKIACGDSQYSICTHMHQNHSRKWQKKASSIDINRTIMSFLGENLIEPDVVTNCNEKCHRHRIRLSFLCTQHTCGVRHARLCLFGLLKLHMNYIQSFTRRSRIRSNSFCYWFARSSERKY